MVSWSVKRLMGGEEQVPGSLQLASSLRLKARLLEEEAGPVDRPPECEFCRDSRIRGDLNS
jgi:hypothetical protein